MELKGSAALQLEVALEAVTGFLGKLIEINCTLLRLLDTRELKLIAHNYIW